MGALVPYILHRDPDGYYRLLGDAYVHGIMDGEGLDEQSRCEYLSVLMSTVTLRENWVGFGQGYHITVSQAA